MSHIRDSKLEQKRASSQSSAPLATTLSAQELLQKLKQLDKELSGYAEKSKKQEQDIYLAVIRLAKHLDKEPQHKKNAKMLYKFALSLSARFGEDVQSELIRIQKRTKFEPFSKEKFSKVVSAASESFKDYFDITGELRTTLRSLVSERNNPLLLGLGGSDVETRNLALELLFNKVFPLFRIAVLPAKINKAIEAIVSEPITTCSKNFPNEKVLSDTISLCLFKTDFQYLSDTVEETRKKYMENAGQMALHMVAESKDEQVKLHEIADEVYQERHRFQVEWQGRALRLMQVEGLPAELLREKMAAITQFELSLDKRKFTLYVNFLMAIGGHAQDQLGINLLNQLKQLHKKITLAKGQDENYQERVKAIAELAGPVKKGEAKKDNRVRLQILHEKALYLHREMQALIKQKNALLKPLQDKQQHPKLSQQERDRYGLLLAEHFYLSLDQQHAGVENSTHYLQQENDQCLLPLLGHLNATMPDAIPPLNLPQNNHIKRHCQVILARRKLLTTIHIELPLAAEGERKGLLNKINLLKKDFIEKTFELVTVVADSISTDTEVMHSVEAMTAIVDPITKVMNDFWTAQAGQGAFKPECQAIVEVFKAKQVVHDALKELQLLDPTAQSRILPTTLQPQDTKIEVAAPRRNSILSLIRRPSQPAIAPILPVTPKRRSSEPAVTAQPQRRGSIFGKPTSQPASLLTLEQARSKLQAAEDAYSACIANAGAAFASRQRNVTPVAIVESKSTPAVETRIITDVKEETPITKKSRPVPRVKAAPSPVLQALIAKLNHQNSTDTSIASESQQPTTDPELVSTNIAPVEAPAVRPDLSALPEILQLTVETTVVAVVEPTSVVEDACATPINTVERSEVKQSPLNASFTSASIAAEFLDATTLYTPSQKPDPQLLMTAIERAGNRSLSEQERQQARGEVYSLLLQGADPNYQRESDGWTPLHSAVNDHDKEMVQLLLKVASPYTRNSKNQTPLGLAQSNRYAEIIPCFSLRPSEIKPLQFVTPKKKPIAATTAQQMFADQLELIFHPTAGEAQTNIAQLAAAYPKQFQDINDCFPIKFPAVNSILSHQNFLNMKVKELNKALAALTNAFNINIEHVEVDQLKTYLPNILTAISLLKQALAAINAFNGYCKTANLEFTNNDALHFSESLQKLEKLHGQIVHRIGLPEIRKEFEEWQASISSQLSSSSSHVDVPTTPSPTESKKSTVRSPTNQLARQCAEQLLEFVASRMEKFPLNQNNIPEHAESISRNTKLLAILDRLMRFFEQQEQSATDDIADAILQLLDGLIVSMVMASGQSELPAEINQQLRAMSSELLQHAEQVGSFLKGSAAKGLHAEITALLKTNLAGFLKPEAKDQVRMESTSSPSRSVSPEQTNNTLENLQRLITSQNIKTALSPVAEGPDDFNSPEVPNTIKLRMLSAHRSEKKSATPQPAASRVSTEVVAPRAVKIFASPVTNGQEAKGTEQPIPSLLTAPVDLKVIFKESVDAVLKDFETVRQQKLQENRAFYSKFFEENAGIFKIISNLKLIIQDKDFDLQKAGYAMLQAAACMAGIFASFQQVSVSAKSQWLAHYKSFGCLHQLLKTLEALQGQSAFSNDYLFRFYSVVYASVKSTCDFYASLDHAQYVWGIKVWSEFETLAEQLKSYAADHQHHPEPMRLALSQAYGELVQLQQDHAAELNDYEIDPYVFVTALIKVVSGVVVRLEKYAQSEVSEEAVVRSAAGQLHRYLQDLHARLVINTMLDDALLGNLKELQNRVDTLRARKVSSPQPVETGPRGLSAGSNVSLADDSIVENILNSEPNVVAESTVLLPVPVAFSVASVVERALQSPADQVASPQNGSNTNPASEVVSSLLATPSPAPEKDSGFVQESPIFSPIVERPNDSLSLIARILAMPSPQPTDKNEDAVPAQVQPLTSVIITTPPRVEKKESKAPSPSNALAMDCAQQLLEYVAARMEKFPLNQAGIVESAATISRNAKLLTILDRLLRFFEGGERPATNNIVDAMLQLLDGLIVSMVIASGQSNLSEDINGQLQAMSGDLLQYAQQIGVLLNDSEAQALHTEIIALLRANLAGFLKTEAKPQPVSLQQANNALENLQHLVTSPQVKKALSPIAEGPGDFDSPEVPNTIKLRLLSARRSEKKSTTSQPATSQISAEVMVPRVVKMLASPVTNSQEAKGTEQPIPSLLPAAVDLKAIFKESVDAVLKDFETVRQQKLQENRAFYSKFFEENAGIFKVISNLTLIIRDKDFDLQKAGYALLQVAACMAGIFTSFQQVSISAKSQWLAHYKSFGCLNQLLKALEALQGQSAFSNDYLFRFYSIVYASVKSTCDFYASLDHAQYVWGIKVWSEFETLAEQLKSYAADHQYHPEAMSLAQLQQDHAAELNDYKIDPYVFVTALIKVVSGVVVRLEKYAQSRAGEEAVVRSAAGQLYRYLQDLHARLVINTMLDDALLEDVKALQNRVNTLRVQKVSSPQPVETGSREQVAGGREEEVAGRREEGIVGRREEEIAEPSVPLSPTTPRSLSAGSSVSLSPATPRGLSAGSNVSLADDSIVENILNTEPNAAAKSTALLPEPVAFNVTPVVERAIQSPADQVASPQNISNTNPASEVVSSLLATPSPVSEQNRKESATSPQENLNFSPIGNYVTNPTVAAILARPSPQPQPEIGSRDQVTGRREEETTAHLSNSLDPLSPTPRGLSAGSSSLLDVAIIATESQPEEKLTPKVDPARDLSPRRLDHDSQPNESDIDAVVTATESHPEETPIPNVNSAQHLSLWFEVKREYTSTASSVVSALNTPNSPLHAQLISPASRLALEEVSRHAAEMPVDMPTIVVDHSSVIPVFPPLDNITDSPLAKGNSPVLQNSSPEQVIAEQKITDSVVLLPIAMAQQTDISPPTTPRGLSAGSNSLLDVAATVTESPRRLGRDFRPNEFDVDIATSATEDHPEEKLTPKTNFAIDNEPADEKPIANLPESIQIISARAFLNYAQSMLQLVANDSRFDDFVSGLESPIKKLQAAINNQQEDILEKVLNLVVRVIDSSMDFVNHWPSIDNYKHMQQAMESLLAQLQLFGSLIDPALKGRYQDLEYACTQFIAELQEAIARNSLEPQESKHGNQGEEDNNYSLADFLPNPDAFDNDDQTILLQADTVLPLDPTPGIATEAFDASIAASLAELTKPHVPSISAEPVLEVSEFIRERQGSGFKSRAKRRLFSDETVAVVPPVDSLLSNQSIFLQEDKQGALNEQSAVSDPQSSLSNPESIIDVLPAPVSVFSDNLPRMPQPVIDLLAPEPEVFKDEKHIAPADNFTVPGPQSPPNISRAASPTGGLEGEIIAGFYAEDAKGAAPLKEDHKDDSFRNRAFSIASSSPPPLRVAERHAVETKEQKAPAASDIFPIAAAGDLDAVRAFLENVPENFDINARDKQGYTVLMYAAANGHDLVVSELLKAMLPGTEATNQLHVTSGRTALMLAVERFTESKEQGRNYGEVISRLLEVKGINVNQIYPDGDSLLIRAIKLGQVKLVEKLRGHKGMTTSASALQQAVRCQDIVVARAMVRELLNASKVVAVDYQKALLLAVQRGDYELVEKFRLNGAPANVLQTALSRAIRCRDIELIKLFRRHHAAIEPATFIAAAARGQWDICRALLCDDNFNLFQPFVNNQVLEAALLHAVTQADEQNDAFFAIRLLRHLGVNPAAALQRAFDRGDLGLISAVFRPQPINGLVSRLEPAVDVSNAVLRIAIARQDIASIHWSLREGADINSRPRADQEIGLDNPSPLLLAIQGGHYLIAHYLIQRGAKLTDIEAAWLPVLALNEDEPLRLLNQVFNGLNIFCNAPLVNCQPRSISVMIRYGNANNIIGLVKTRIE
jgi:ankyrin repeat protein